MGFAGTRSSASTNTSKAHRNFKIKVSLEHHETLVALFEQIYLHENTRLNGEFYSVIMFDESIYLFNKKYKENCNCIREIMFGACLTANIMENY